MPRYEDIDLAWTHEAALASGPTVVVAAPTGLTVDDIISELKAWRDDNEDAVLRVRMGDSFATFLGGMTDTPDGPVLETVPCN